MSDYQRVVEYLRDVRSSPVTAVTDELRQYAAQYAELCRQANERLRRCTAMLQRGLRSEALQLAAEPPNLLQLVDALDLPDASIWADTCQQFDLPVPPPLQMDRAEQLRAAMNQEPTLEELLRRHRQLALERAPLRERLEVMRRIAGLDTESPFWDRDIRTFEHARLKEMRLELAAAVRNNDAAAISQLAAELEENQWRQPIPDDLQKAVNHAFHLMMKTEVEARLTELLQRLREAHAAKDFDQCMEIVQQSRQILESAGVDAVSSSLVAEFQPIVRWVQQEQEQRARQQAFASACEKMSQLLDAEAPDDALCEQYRKLQAAGQPIPDDLAARYRALLERRASRRRMRLVLRWGLAGAAALVVLVAVMLAVEHSAAAQWAGRIRQAVAEGDLALARRLADEQEQRARRLSLFPSVAAAKSELAEREKQFAADRKALDELLAAVAPGRAEAEALLRDAAAQAPALAAGAASVSLLLRRIDTAARLEWVDADRKLAALRSELEELRTQLRQRAGDSMRREMEALVEEVRGIAPSPDVDRALASLSAAEEKAKLLRAQELDESAASMLATVDSLIDQRRQAALRWRRQQEAIAALRQAPPSAGEWKQRIETLAGEFPDAPLAKDLKLAAARIEYAATVEQWAAVVAQWEDPLPHNTSAAIQRARVAGDYAATHPSSPFAREAAAYAEYLRQAAEVLGDKGIWHTGLGEMLRNPMLTDMWRIRAGDGRTWYTIGSDIKRRDGPKLEKTFEALDPKNAPRTVTITLPKEVTLEPKPQPLPHTLAVARLADQIRQIDDTNWDTWAIDAIDELARRDDIEPTVQAIILHEMIRTNQKVLAWAVPGIYEKADAALARLALDSIPWYDYQKPVGEGTNAAIRAAIKRIPPASEVKQKYLARKADMLRAVGFRITGTAVLMKDDAGEWQIYGALAPPDQTTAWTVSPPPFPGQPATLVPLAVARGGRFVIDSAAVRDMPQGLLVYLVPPQRR